MLARAADPGPDAVPGVFVEGSRSLREAGLFEEELLREGRAAVHVAELASPALSYGVSVSEAAAYVERARAAGVETVRRQSGGTGLLCGPGDLVWALVVPTSDRLAGRDYVRAYGRLGRGLVTWLGARGANAAWGPALGLSDACCPLGARGSVLLQQGRVVAAAAQHRTSTALLHQGWLAKGVDRALLSAIFELPVPGPSDRLAGWTELVGELDSGVVAQELARHLAGAFTRS